MHVLIHDRVHRLWRCECGEIIGSDYFSRCTAQIIGVEVQDHIVESHRRHVRNEYDLVKNKFGNSIQRLIDECIA